MTVSTALVAIAALIIGGVVGWSLHSARVASRPHISTGQDDDGVPLTRLVEPLHRTLDMLAAEVRRSENHRAADFAGLREQVHGVRQANSELQSQTQRLASALSSPNVRGHWGELQLQRVVELAGMSEHVDFRTQVSATVRTDTGEATIRPDMVIHLAGGRTMVVDAKAPLEAFRSMIAGGKSDNPQVHARHLRSHIQTLGSKQYWAAFTPSPELVVMFIPSESVLDAAARASPDLIEYAFSRGVVLATPTTLLTLLRTVALGWRQQALSHDAHEIHRLGRELLERIGTVTGHLDRLGASLGKSVEAFNATVGSMDSRVGVTARKLSELDVFADTAPPQRPGQVDRIPRRGLSVE